MNRLHLLTILMTAMALTTGCTPNPLADGSPTEPDFDAILALLNADLGAEDKAVTREEVEEAFEDDPELLNAVLSDPASS